MIGQCIFKIGCSNLVNKFQLFDILDMQKIVFSIFNRFKQKYMKLLMRLNRSNMAYVIYLIIRVNQYTCNNECEFPKVTRPPLDSSDNLLTNLAIKFDKGILPAIIRMSQLRLTW